MANLGDMVVKIVGDNSELNKALDSSEKKLNDLGATAGKIGKVLSIGVTTPMIALGAAALKSAGQFQLFQTSFETMLGSATKAKTLIGDLQKLAAATPFTFTDLADASKTLLQFNVELDDLMPTIKTLGDIAHGNGDKFSRLALAFGQTQAAGRLMGQDLLQMINAGFNPLQMISKLTGETMGQLKKRMEDGALSAREVSLAFKAATEQGGPFFNGMEKASKTLPGLVSTLSDDVAALGRSFADILMPTAMDTVKTLSAMAKAFTDLDSPTKTFILTLVGFAAAAGPAALAIRGVSSALVFLAGNPIVLAIAGAVALTAAMVGLANAGNRAKQEVGLALAGKSDLTPTTQIALLQKELDLKKHLETAREYKGSALEAQREQIKARIEDLKWQEFARQATEATTAAEKKQAEASAAEQLQKIARAEEEKKLKEEEVRTNAILDAEIEGLREIRNENEISHMEEAREREEAHRQEQISKKAEMENKIAELHRLGAEGRAKVEDEEAEKKRDREKQIANLIVSVNKSMFTYLGESLAKWETSWQGAGTVAINSIGRIVSAIGDMATVQAAAELAKWIASWFTNGPALAASVQWGLAAAAAYTAGGYLSSVKLAEGGVVIPRPGGVEATVAEAGVPEAVIPLDKLDRMLATGSSDGGAAGGDIHLQVNLDSRPFLDTIFPASRNRLILIDGGAVV